jgi:hypothetical protein
VLEVFLLKNQTSLLALSLIGYNAAQLPGELIPQPGMVIKGACSDDKRMFERYTEKARRVIFFARYEASQFGAPAIEPEHLLLGLMREDKTLTGRFFPRAPVSIE